MPTDFPPPRGRRSIEDYIDGSMMGLLAIAALFAVGLLAIFLFTDAPDQQTAANQPMNLEAINKASQTRRQ